MNDEKIKELLTYLESIGFGNPEFEGQIREAINKRQQRFNLEHSVSFGIETLKFNLYFLWDFQFNAYKLATYPVSYRPTPEAEEITGEYGPLAKGTYHVNLVYHDLSGRLENLYEKFQSLDLEHFTDVELYWELQSHLSHNPEKFEIKCSRNNPEGFIEYIIPVEKTNGNHELTTYKATFTPYPPIQHSVYNGIDTLALEELMTKIDWHNDKELFIFHQDAEPEFMPKVGEVQEQMYRLSLDMIGADIADQLGLKYWRDVTFFGDNLQQSAWDYEDALPRRSQNFPTNLKIKAAFNALCGRAIFQNKAHRLLEDNPAWKRFDFTLVGPNGSYVCEIIPGFDKENSGTFHYQQTNRIELLMDYCLVIA